MVLYQNGALSGVRVVPLGGAAMTKDLAAVLRISQADAERVKREVFSPPGHNEPPAPEEEDAPPPSEEAMSAAGRRVQVREVVEARLEEILRKVKSDLDRLRQGAFLARGVVLTGGVARMPNIVSFAEKIFEMPVSVGHPGERVQGLVDQTSGPEFASAVGLLYFARDQWSPAEVPVRELPVGETASPEPVKKEREGPPAGVRLWNWLREII